MRKPVMLGLLLVVISALALLAFVDSRSAGEGSAMHNAIQADLRALEQLHTRLTQNALSSRNSERANHGLLTQLVDQISAVGRQLEDQARRLDGAYPFMARLLALGDSEFDQLEKSYGAKWKSYKQSTKAVFGAVESF